MSGASKRAIPATPGPTENSLVTRGEWILGGLVFALALGVLLYGAWVLNGEAQDKRFAAVANEAVATLDGTIGELDTLIETLVSMHHVDAAVSELSALEVFAADLRQKIPAITAFGRYATVHGEDVEFFERELLDSGLYDFKVISIDDDGRAGDRGSSFRHYPVTRLEPMAPERLRLLGADLGDIEGLTGALNRIAVQNHTLMTTLPEHWPAAGELMLFHTIYRGNHVPADFRERLRQANGGYWLAVDPQALLGDASALAGRLSLELQSSTTGGDALALLSIAGEREPGTLLHALYSPAQTQRSWSLGDGELVLVLSAERGVPVPVLGAVAVIATMILFALLTAGSVVAGNRLARRDRARGLLNLQAERERADRTLNAIGDAVFALDAQQRVLHLNPAAARLAGHARSSVPGLAMADALPLRNEEDDTRLDLDAVFASIERGGPKEIDVLPWEDASTKRATVLRMSVSRTRDTHGEISGHILVLRDISDERLLTRRLAWQANHDALTGCTNRRWFEANLGEMLRDIPLSGRRHALCYIDLDQFKVINDTNGHAAGDRLLQELTAGLQALCREADILSRLGGDEFGLLIVDADEETAREAAGRVHDFFQSCTFQHGKDVIDVRASIGLVLLDECSGNISDVLAAADLACYAAKDGGRNALYVYSSDDATMSQRSSELERLPELRRALADDRFELHVQAVADLGERQRGQAGMKEIVHYEFLLRLAGEDGKPIAPFQIIEAAERYGLMRDIDRWVIARAIASVAAISDRRGRACSFSINLSGQSAADPTLIDFIEEEYGKHEIDPSRIWFELTETAAISQFAVAVELATRIRALGSKVALDDFGSGLSSFGYLKNIPVDVLKIDGQFVRHLADSSVDRAIVGAIADVAASMHIETVAEFVENQTIVDELVKLGIDYAQGYHIAKPCPLSEAIDALSPARAGGWANAA